MTDADFAQTVRAAFQAFNERRFADFAAYMTDDVVEAYPQSGEELVGRDIQQAFHETFPNPPTFTVRHIRHDGNLAVIELDEAYADGSVWKDAFVMEIRDGKVASMTGYFGQPFPAPEWRRPYFRVEAGEPGATRPEVPR